MRKITALTPHPRKTAAYLKSSVERYLSPVSQRIVTITLPLFSGLAAICAAPSGLPP